VAIVGGFHADFNDVALARCREKIDIRHASRYDASTFELAGRKDKGFFVNPFEASTTE
jgi:hypothetical protein